MSAVTVAPVDTVMTRGAMMTDDARAMNRQHSAAASSSDKGRNGIDGLGIDSGFVVIVIRIIVVIDAADKGAAEVAVMEEGPADKSRTCCNAGHAGADRATAHDRTAEAASGDATSAAKTAEGAAATTAAAATSSTAMPTTNFNHPFIGSGRSGMRHPGIHRRQSFGARAGQDRSHQQCDDCAQHTQRTSRKD